MDRRFRLSSTALAIVIASLGGNRSFAEQAQELWPAPPLPHFLAAQPEGDSTGLSQDEPEEIASPESELVDELLNLDVDQLANVQVNLPVETTPATLTETRANVVPAAITRISKEEIYRSGARSLNELLDIYVPSLQWVRHHWELSHLGMRGIINDREDKYLLLVNGRIMNDKTHYGAASERFNVQLDDIHHVDVIRGPGSAVLGPGAVSMVISIYTDTAETFQGTKAVARGGFIDEFSSLELKHGTEWQHADGGVFLYGGIGSRDGADQRDAPLVFGGSDPVPQVWDPRLPANGGTPPVYDGYQAGTYVRTPINNDHESFQGQLPIKAFADIIYNDFEIWARYTRAGEQFAIAPAAGLHFDNGFGSFVPQQQHESGVQQVTVQSKYETEINENLRFLATLGWDSSDFVRLLFNTPDVGPAEAYNEQELNSRAIFISEMGDHQIAFGGEFYHDWFGLEGHLIDSPAVIGRLGGAVNSWETRTYSILLEDQWQMSDDWTWFVGGRLDKNTYTPWMYSPRAALVWTPTETLAWKALLNRSVRMNFAEELRAQWISNGTLSDPEILRSYELRCESSPFKDFSWAASAFYLDLDALSWNQTTSTSSLIGNQTQWGLEAEFWLKRRYGNIIFSHSYIQLIDFTLFDPSTVTFISAAPNGFGNDLNAWSDHITKIALHRQVTDALSYDWSLRYYWGFPGSEDVNNRTTALAVPGSGTYVSEPGWKRPWRESVFFNLGLAYQYNDHLRMRLDGYNLLGGFERDLNKRIFHGDNSFRSEAPALGVSAELLY